MPELIEDNEIEEIVFTKDIVKPNRNYIDDAHLTPILAEWSDRRRAAKEAGEELPQLPVTVARAIMDMSEALGKRFNFSNYSYLDEMQSDAIIHCVKYIHNFNPMKKSEKKGRVSAFGYINMIIWRAFTHRIEEEKREQYFKYKSFQIMGGMEAFQDDDMAEAGGGDESSNLSIGMLAGDFLSKIAEYEDKYIADKIKKDKKAIKFDSFMFELAAEASNYDDEILLEE